MTLVCVQIRQIINAHVMTVMIVLSYPADQHLPLKVLLETIETIGSIQ